jgi:hypothetical protein
VQLLKAFCERKQAPLSKAIYPLDLGSEGSSLVPLPPEPVSGELQQRCGFLKVLVQIVEVAHPSDQVSYCLRLVGVLSGDAQEPESLRYGS